MASSAGMRGPRGRGVQQVYILEAQLERVETQLRDMISRSLSDRPISLDTLMTFQAKLKKAYEKFKFILRGIMRSYQSGRAQDTEMLLTKQIDIDNLVAPKRRVINELLEGYGHHASNSTWDTASNFSGVTSSNFSLGQYSESEDSESYHESRDILSETQRTEDFNLSRSQYIADRYVVQDQAYCV